MNVCTKCQTVEGNWREEEIDGSLVEVCCECDGEDCKKTYDEDYGKDR